MFLKVFSRDLNNQFKKEDNLFQYSSLKYMVLCQKDYKILKTKVRKSKFK